MIDSIAASKSSTALVIFLIASIVLLVNFTIGISFAQVNNSVIVNTDKIAHKLRDAIEIFGMASSANDAKQQYRDL